MEPILSFVVPMRAPLAEATTHKRLLLGRFYRMMDVLSPHSRRGPSFLVHKLLLEFDRALTYIWIDVKSPLPSQGYSLPCLLD